MIKLRTESSTFERVLRLSLRCRAGYDSVCMGSGGVLELVSVSRRAGLRGSV